jgi:hypothetical protein
MTTPQTQYLIVLTFDGQRVVWGEYAYAPYADKAATDLRRLYPTQTVTIETVAPSAAPSTPKRPRNLAYQVQVRRICTGTDFHIRLFAVDAETAERHATNRARVACNIPLAKYRDLNAKGVAVFRIVSCAVSADQRRAQDTLYDVSNSAKG